ncbi:hypothetical protein D9757_001010 [Collybiopsis confluens]|uniref:Rhodopsin domain-containing protein n=1 Tax=Collybiopsis confluens TaxID=2823264 RepID=A0A8H5I0Z3_9AGAR|nr:hypothetical protein D9757_001010 [Collybiopsis confluens]
MVLPERAVLSESHIGKKANLAFSIVLLVVALSTTVTRICARYRNRRLWWDDGWALLALGFAATMDVSSLLGSDEKPANNNRRTRIMHSWITLVTYTVGIWCARITLLMSILRLIPTFFTLRRITEFASIAFLLMCLSVFIPTIYFCVSDLFWGTHDVPSWGSYASGDPALALLSNKSGQPQAKVCIFALFLTSDCDERPECLRMLVIMFSATLITSIISILHAVFLVSSAWNLAAVAVEAQMSTALTVANLAILTPYLYRLIKPEEDFDSEPCTYYRSYEPDGVIRVRRVSDLAPDVRFTDMTRVSLAPTERDSYSLNLTEVNPESAATTSDDSGYASQTLAGSSGKDDIQIELHISHTLFSSETGSANSESSQ